MQSCRRLKSEDVNVIRWQRVAYIASFTRSTTENCRIDGKGEGASAEA